MITQSKDERRSIRAKVEVTSAGMHRRMNFEEYCSLKGLELWKAHGLTTGRVEENADLAFTRRVLDGKIQGHCRHARADNLAYYHNLGQNSMSLNDGSIKVQKRRAKTNHRDRDIRKNLSEQLQVILVAIVCYRKLPVTAVVHLATECYSGLQSLMAIGKHPL